MEEIRKKHGLALIIMHGSQVSGRVHKLSDMDIAVVRRNINNKLDLLSLISDLKKELKTDRVDLVDITTANPLLFFAVMRRSKLLSGSRKDYDKYLRLAFNKYSDYQPYLRLEADFVKAKIASYA